MSERGPIVYKDGPDFWRQMRERRQQEWVGAWVGLIGAVLKVAWVGWVTWRLLR